MFKTNNIFSQASLIAVAFEKPFDTSAQLVKNDMTVGLVSGSTFMDQLRTSPIQSHRELYKTASFYQFDQNNKPWNLWDSVVDNGRSCMFISHQT